MNKKHYTITTKMIWILRGIAERDNGNGVCSKDLKGYWPSVTPPYDTLMRLIRRHLIKKHDMRPLRNDYRYKITKKGQKVLDDYEKIDTTEID